MSAMFDRQPRLRLSTATGAAMRPRNLLKGAIIGATLALVSACQATHVGLATPAPTLFASIVAQEYQQLASIKRPVAAPGQARRVFGSKAMAAAAGGCPEPELPQAWRHWRNISADIAGSTVGADDLRRQVLQREIAARDHPEMAVRFPELEAARAHLLGRYDCIVAYGRDRRYTSVARSCVNEAKAAATYIDKAFAGYPEPPPLLCPSVVPTNEAGTRSQG